MPTCQKVSSNTCIWMYVVSVEFISIKVCLGLDHKCGNFKFRFSKIPTHILKREEKPITVYGFVLCTLTPQTDWLYRVALTSGIHIRIKCQKAQGWKITTALVLNEPGSFEADDVTQQSSIKVWKSKKELYLVGIGKEKKEWLGSSYSELSRVLIAFLIIHWLFFIFIGK